MTHHSRTTTGHLPSDMTFRYGSRPEGGASSARSHGHLDYIDGLRGLALTTVLLYHFWQDAHCPVGYWWNPLQVGYSGVNLFLVLSGFCLYWPLVRPNRSSPEPTLLEFARRRAHRLLPPYYVALALFAGLALLWHARGWVWSDGALGDSKAIMTSAAWHALLIQNLRPRHLWTIDGPLWSLALEAQLYVAMPILVVTARRWGIGRAVGLAALVTLGYRLGVNAYVGGDAGWAAMPANYAYVLASSLPGRWLEFALGMWAASLAARRVLEDSRVPFGVFGMVCLGAALYLRALSQEGPFTDAVLGLAYFCLLLHVSRIPGTAWPSLSRALRWPPLVWLGTISYSVYLVHNPLLKTFIDAFGLQQARDGKILALLLFLFLPALIGVSYGFYLLAEKPFLNKKAPRSAAATLPPQTSVPVGKGHS